MAFTAGCNQNWPVSSAPEGNRSGGGDKESAVACGDKRGRQPQCAGQPVCVVAEEKPACPTSLEAILQKLLDEIGGLSALRKALHSP